MSEVIRCPVCGKEKKQISLSDFDCEYCGFNNAFVKLFASEKSYEIWRESVSEAVQNLIRKRRSLLSDSHCLRVGDGTIAFLENENKKIYIALSGGKVQIEDDAVEFDSSERNYAVVYKNGKVKVFGSDNEFGQKNTETWMDINYVLTVPNCTYGVTRKGTIVYAGSPADASILKWRNVRTLRSYEEFIVGILNDGSIILPENLPMTTELKSTEKWEHIKDVAVFRDGIVGLKNDGTVFFLGKEDDPKNECVSWQDIISIEVDNTYIYGLSKNGKILVAGNCKKILDKGRKDSTLWNNIMLISCNKAGIGAVDEKGKFLFAGTISGDKTKIVAACDNCTRVLLHDND